MLRDFANEISLFCMRMADVGLRKENYTCIIMQDVYQRLDHNTALRYRSKMELKKELGGNVEEHLDRLSTFLHSEATTLELSMGDSFLSSSTKSDSPKFNAMSVGEKVKLTPERFKCVLGCDEMHRFVEYKAYMGMVPEKRVEFIKNFLRCYVCLGSYHTARNS